MKALRRISGGLVALALMAAPATAMADDGAAHPMLRGPMVQASTLQGSISPGAVIDPLGVVVSAGLHVVPPAGGHVMLYRDGQPVAWWLQPTFATLTPGKVYGLVAVRGSEMLFNASIVARRGVTELAFAGDSNIPALSYQPPVVLSPETGLPEVDLPRGPISSASFDELLAEMDLRTSDSARFSLLKRNARRYLFSSWQTDRLIDAFEDPRYRTAAETLLSGKRR